MSQEDRKERYEERAAIIEEGCKVSRMVAEAMARQHEEKLQAQEKKRTAP